ncbi:alpha/beta hydrolase [Granulicoccus phenolivorans]|uniref:alpha/beta hydrolase n=1 Tax=Granulicoccus phenolivorans TaxID=266854 RepID=UPI000428C183|nr:alpha/beta fold hydrolase [Granulicoccus phenolivorans]
MPYTDSSAPEAAGAKPGFAEHTRAFEGGSGELGVLLCHGFTGSPGSLRPWAEHLVEAGFRVRLPLLPGHGTTWEQLNETSWTDWYATVETAFRLLRQECRAVFIGGLSMGGSLALRLAERYGDDVAALALVNPAVSSANPALKALPVLRRFVPSVKGITNDIARGGDEWGYDRTPLQALSSMTELWRNVRQNLDRVDQPLLLFRSATDHVVDPGSAKTILAGINSHDVTVRTLERSYHVATLDYDAPAIFAESVRFFRAHDPRRAEADHG